jgi:hypothetical protein
MFFAITTSYREVNYDKKEKSTVKGERERERERYHMSTSILKLIVVNLLVG